MKSIYIMLTRSETILSRLVYLVTRDTYTHASISFDENLSIIYSSSRKDGHTIFPAGPCQESLSNGYYSSHHQIPCAVYELKVENNTYEAALREVDAIMKESKLYHFNILGLLLCHLGIPYRRKHHFFCSEFVGEILCRSKAFHLPKDSSLMRPNDYASLPGLLCRFQGQISELAANVCTVPVAG